MLSFKKSYFSRLLFLMLFLTGSVFCEGFIGEPLVKPSDYVHCESLDNQCYAMECKRNGNNIIIIMAAPVVVPAATITVATAAKAIVGVGILGSYVYSILFAKSASEQKSKNYRSCKNNNQNGDPCWCLCACGIGCNCLCHCPCGLRNQQLKKEANKNPHGIYKDAEYHHENSRGNGHGGKGSAPKNGQQALNNSIPMAGFGAGRIGVSQGQIVELKQTSVGVFHGFVITYEELMQHRKYRGIAKELQEAGLLDAKGKPLK